MKKTLSVAALVVALLLFGLIFLTGGEQEPAQVKRIPFADVVETGRTSIPSQKTSAPAVTATPKPTRKTPASKGK